jgi:hypothetical protein
VRPSALRRASPSAALVCAASILLALATALPAVWLHPLHVDEGTTLVIAVHSWGEIAHKVFVDRGGGPLHFFLEHLTLGWPGGILGLRLPSVAFLAALLPAAWLFARDLLGRTAAAGLVLMLAVAPLTVSLAAFARPYTLLLLCILVSAWLSLRAARGDSVRMWVLAGALAGALYLVHPLAPLYAALAFATGPIASDRPFRQVARNAIPGAIAFVVALAPYGAALVTLGRRYEVGVPGTRSGVLDLSVAAKALDALTPAGRVGWMSFAFAATCGLAILVRSRPRVALALTIWLAVPVVFFAITPANDTHFVGRYMFPALPAFLLLIVTAFSALGSLTPRRPLLPAAAGIAAVLAWSGVEAAAELKEAHAVDVMKLAAVVRAAPPGTIVFGTTGILESYRTQATPVRASRPAELLDSYLELTVDHVRLVDELPAVDPYAARHLIRRGADEVDSLLDENDRRSVGIWIFPGRESDPALASGRPPLSVPGTRVDVVAGRYVVVRTTGPHTPRELLRIGISIRQQWMKTHWTKLVEKMLFVDRLALSRGRFWWLGPPEHDIYAVGRSGGWS